MFLLLNNKTNLRMLLGQLKIEKTDKTEIYKPSEIPYDIIVYQTRNGYLSVDAVRMLAIKKIPVVFLDVDGSTLSQLLPVMIDASKRIKQYTLYNSSDRLKIAQNILEGKITHYKQFLQYLAQVYKFEMPETVQITGNSIKELLGNEGINANRYWAVFTKIMRENFASDYTGRISGNNREMNSEHWVNSLLNYGYKLLEIEIRKAIALSNLDSEIGFVHEIRQGKSPLVYDLQEPFRFLVDYTVFTALENKMFSNKDFYRTREYIVRLRPATTEKFVALFNQTLTQTTVYKGLNTKWQTVIQNSLYKFADDFKIPDFTFAKTRTDNLEVRKEILSKKLTGKNKSTTWYRQHRIQQGLPLKLYKARKR